MVHSAGRATVYHPSVMTPSGAGLVGDRAKEDGPSPEGAEKQPDGGTHQHG